MSLCDNLELKFLLQLIPFISSTVLVTVFPFHHWLRTLHSQFDWVPHTLPYCFTLLLPITSPGSLLLPYMPKHTTYSMWLPMGIQIFRFSASKWMLGTFRIIFPQPNGKIVFPQVKQMLLHLLSFLHLYVPPDRLTAYTRLYSAYADISMLSRCSSISYFPSSSSVPMLMLPLFNGVTSSDSSTRESILYRSSWFLLLLTRYDTAHSVTHFHDH